MIETKKFLKNAFPEHLDIRLFLKGLTLKELSEILEVTSEMFPSKKRFSYHEPFQDQEREEVVSMIRLAAKAYKARYISNLPKPLPEEMSLFSLNKEAGQKAYYKRNYRKGISKEDTRSALIHHHSLDKL